MKSFTIIQFVLFKIKFSAKKKKKMKKKDLIKDFLELNREQKISDCVKDINTLLDLQKKIIEEKYKNKKIKTKKIKKMTKVKIIKNKEKPETTQILAEAIIKISNAMEKLSLESGLSEEALILLIQDNCETIKSGYTRTKPTKTIVRIVLRSMKTLKGYYLRKK